MGSPVDEPELGYRLVASAWGKGYAIGGGPGADRQGFESPLVSRVVAEAMAAHGASRRVMEKAGLRYVRAFSTEWPVRIPGDELGDVEYAITSAEWMASLDATGELPGSTPTNERRVDPSDRWLVKSDDPSVQASTGIDVCRFGVTD